MEEMVQEQIPICPEETRVMGKANELIRFCIPISKYSVINDHYIFGSLISWNNQPMYS